MCRLAAAAERDVAVASAERDQNACLDWDSLRELPLYATLARKTKWLNTAAALETFPKGVVASLKAVAAAPKVVGACMMTSNNL